LSDSVTVVPPVGAAELSVTVHVLVPLELTVVGLHASDDSVTGGASVTVAVFETPLSVAVTVTLWLLVMVPAVTVKVAVVAFAATVTEDGVVNNELLSDSVTVVPPVGAAELSVTVHVLVPLELTVVGLHASDDNVTGADRLTVAVCETPLSVAVTVALWSLVIVPAVTVNVAVVAFAATVTDDGVVNSELLSDSVTAVPPVGAALLNVTVHVLVPLELTVVGLHASDDNVTGADRLTVAVCETPLSVAVTVALWSLVIVPAVTVNVAVVAFDATVTDDGVVNCELLSDSVTAVPPVAALLNVTVQVLLPLELTVVGLHASDDNVTGADRLTVAVCEMPLSVAVTVVLWSLVIVPAVTVNVAVVAFAATVTDVGVVKSELLSESVTTVPPVGAAELNITVHVLVPLELSVVGVQDTETSDGAVVVEPIIVPPVVETDIALPAADAAVLLPTAIEVELTPDAIVTFTDATTPFAMVLAFIPDARHVYVPDPPMQVIVLPALVSAAPAVAEIAITSEAANVNVH